MNTGDPVADARNRISRGGTGLVQPAKSTATEVIATANGGGDFDVSMNFGFEELKANFSKTKAFRLVNNGSSPATFSVSVRPTRRVRRIRSASQRRRRSTVPGRQQHQHLDDPERPGCDRGQLRRVPRGRRHHHADAGRSDNNGVTLRVPYYLVPRALANVKTTVGGKLQGKRRPRRRRSRTRDGAIRATYDFYAWGLEEARSRRARRRTTSARSACSRSRSLATEQLDRVRGQRPQPLVERGDERVRHPARRQR